MTRKTNRWLALLTAGILLAAGACTTDAPEYSSNVVNNDPGNNDPGNNDPGNNDPGNNDPGNNDPGNNDPGNNDPGPDIDAGMGDDAGMEDDAGGNIPDTETIGAGCFQDFDCSEGELCVGADARFNIEGYCTVLDCETSADCAFPRGGTFCCSNFGNFRGCFREDDDAVCGDESGQQNDPCVEGGQSDCDGADDLYCAEFYGDESAICTEACTPGNDRCQEGTYCFQTAPNFGICLPHGDSEEYEDCRDDPFNCDEGFFCLQQIEDDPHRYCAQLCTGDEQCEPGDWCQRFPGQQQGVCEPIGEIEEGDSCTEDRFGCGEDLFCLYEGTRYAECTSLCRRQEDCDGEAGFACDFYDEENNLGICVNYGERETGDECGDNPFACQDGAFCIGGYGNFFNPEAYCADECTGNPNICPEGFFCQEFGEQAFCQPDGDAQPGDLCDGPTDCARDSFCIQGEEGERFCAGTCFTDDECSPNEYCTGENDQQGICYPFGDIDAGEDCEGQELQCEEGAFCAGPDPVCISSCTDDPGSCPEGMYCLEANENGQRFCYPHGDTEGYAECEGDYDCEPNFYCSRRGDQALCLPNCDGDSDCADGFWCFRTRTWSQCLPDRGGLTGDSCADDGYACAQDHLCLYSGTSDAICVQDCTGFSGACGDGETCRYIGWGLNICHPIGEGDVGDSCVDDALVCGEDSICAGVGRRNAFCAQLCSFDPEGCPDGTECVFSQGGLGTCLPPNFDPGDPIDGGGPL